MHISKLFINIIFSTLGRLDMFVIQYNIMGMNPFENYKFDCSVDFVRTLILGMLTKAIHIELLIISFSRGTRQGSSPSPLSLDDSRYTDNQDNSLTFKSE